MLQHAAASLCDGLVMALPKGIRLRSSSQMREVNTHGAAGGRAWLRPSVCVKAVGTRCHRGVNRQGSELDNLARVTPGCVRDADRQTDRQICIYQNRDSVLQTENSTPLYVAARAKSAVDPAIYTIGEKHSDVFLSLIHI